MDGYSNVIDQVGIPFAGGLRPLAPPGSSEAVEPGYGEQGSGSWLSSPFSEGLLDAAGSEAETAFTEIAAELEDEEFDEAVQALVDQAAGRHLASEGTWSSESTEHPATGAVESWMAGIAAEADRVLEHLEVHFGGRTAESLVEGELDAVLGEQGLAVLDGEDFVGALARKARSLARGAAKLARRGIAVAGRHLLGPMFAVLRKLVRPLLQRVLAIALDKLPPHLRQDAAALAGKLGFAVPTASTAAVPEPAPQAEPATPGAALAELFDAHLAHAVVTENEAMADQTFSEFELSPAAGEGEAGGATARLDAARSDLVGTLVDAAPGSVLTAEVEQFIPAVMAALPLVRTGIKVIGRDKVVGLVARPIAELIKGHVGPEATRALSRAIADKGLALLRLEAEDGVRGRLGAEALASTVEDTIRAVGQLPPESQAEPLRLRAEVQEAFTEAAVQHLPAEMLRADLEAHEMEGESAVWVLMPRGPSRRYRYRKLSQIFGARIGRNVARAIVLADGGSLEQRFLDEGATGWPVEAEVHLYESLPGTQLGHLAVAEAQDAGATGEFEDLTAQAASLLLGQPGLARRPVPGAGVGRRYYRVVVPRRPAAPRRRPKRVLVRLVLTGPRPVVRVHLRLGEREAHRVGELLAAAAEVRVVAAFRSLILGMAQRSLPGRLTRQARRTPGAALSQEQATALAAAIGERMVAAVAAQLRPMAPMLAAAARDPAPGVTLTFEFGFADRSALTAGRPNAPTVTVRPGRRHD